MTSGLPSRRFALPHLRAPATRRDTGSRPRSAVTLVTLSHVTVAATMQKNFLGRFPGREDFLDTENFLLEVLGGES